MKIRGSVVSLSFIFPHPPEVKNNKKKTKKHVCSCTFYFKRAGFLMLTAVVRYLVGMVNCAGHPCISRGTDRISPKNKAKKNFPTCPVLEKACPKYSPK